ncbi:hypothetical protein GCM10028862_18370 [Luteimonas pelagia]
MSPTRSIAILIAGLALAACDPAREPAPAAGAPAAAADAGVDAAVDAAVPDAQAFMAGLALDFPHEVTSHRQVAQKGGGNADVFAIDYTEGSVRTIDRQLAAALRAAGFERGDRTVVPGGVRVGYVADDGRRVSTMIRNKKYFGDRIASTSAGQISLSYVLR